MLRFQDLFKSSKKILFIVPIILIVFAVLAALLIQQFNARQKININKNVIAPVVTPTISSKGFDFSFSEGECSVGSDCSYADFGCGGGHGICSNNSEKYQGMITTCEINSDHPSMQGYQCSCVLPEGKCGWVN